MPLPDPLGHPLIQRLDHIRDISAPHRLRGPGNLKALPLENIFQPIEWEVICKFASYDESQQPWAGKTFFDRRLRLGGYGDLRIFSLPLTMGARILLAHMLEAFEVSRDVLDLPGLLAADFLALHTATRADPFFCAQLVYVGLHRKISKVGQSTPPLAALRPPQLWLGFRLSKVFQVDGFFFQPLGELQQHLRQLVHAQTIRSRPVGGLLVALQLLLQS
jgi:hypothetical protein